MPREDRLLKKKDPVNRERPNVPERATEFSRVLDDIAAETLEAARGRLRGGGNLSAADAFRLEAERLEDEGDMTGAFRARINARRARQRLPIRGAG